MTISERAEIAEMTVRPSSLSIILKAWFRLRIQFHEERTAVFALLRRVPMSDPMNSFPNRQVRAMPYEVIRKRSLKPDLRANFPGMWTMGRRIPAL